MVRKWEEEMVMWVKCPECGAEFQFPPGRDPHQLDLLEKQREAAPEVDNDRTGEGNG